MKIQVRLHGALRDKLPPEVKGSVVLDVPEATAVSHIPVSLNLTTHIQIALNNEIIENLETRLHDGDTIDIFRPAAGGE